MSSHARNLILLALGLGLSGCPDSTTGTSGTDISLDATTAPDAAKACESAADCDDQNPCTADFCSSNTCSNEPLEGKACDDGDSCTTGDVCDAVGTCVGGDPVLVAAEPCEICSCDPVDGVVCTPSVAGASCDDGLCCTIGDTCQACIIGDPGCSGLGLLCAGDGVDCDDDDGCTVDSCGCSGPSPDCAHVPAADNTTCDYNPNDCTVGDVCQAGSCQVGLPADLDDANPCTQDICVKGVVEHQPLTEGQCDDGNECTTNDNCLLGTCVGGGPVSCTIAPCAADAECVQGQGCITTWLPSGAVCQGADACVVDYACDAAHNCVATGQFDCDDSDPCTVDVCDGATGACSHTAAPDGANCTDGDSCTLADVCTAGTCAGTPQVCDDSDPCTADTCDTTTGACVFSAATDCSVAAGPCLQAACNPATGACDLPVADGTGCDDGDLCTATDICTAGSCGGTPELCEDFDDCTDDACDPGTGLCSNDMIQGCSGCVDDPVVLDTTFGTGGSATYITPGTGYDAGAYAIARQTDGKYVIGGRYFVTDAGRLASLLRILPDGTVDTTFSGDGYVNDLFTTPSAVRELHILDDGRILGGGDLDNRAMIVRLLDDGTLDPSFAAGAGFIKHPNILANYNNRDHLVIDSTGGYVIAGWSGLDFNLARYDAAGIVDATFGTAGVAVASLTTGSDQAYTLVMQPDGKIIAGGIADSLDFGLARFNVDGTLDSTFGTAGTTVTDITATVDPDRIHGLAIDPLGRIVAAGCGDCNFNYQHDNGFALARYSSVGILDPTFGNGGIVFDPIPATVVNGPGRVDGAHTVMILPSTKLLVAGYTHFNAGEGRMLLARYNDDGSLDTCFDGDGYYVQASLAGAGSQADVAWDLLREVDGSIMVLGSVNPSGSGSMGLFRMEP